MHVSDNDGREDKHWNPGKGVIDWDGFIEELGKARNLETLALEVFPEGEELSEEAFLEEAYDVACRLGRKIETAPANKSLE